MYTGTLLHDMVFRSPFSALFFNQNPNKLVVASEDNIFIVDVSTQSTEPFSGTFQGACYQPHTLALSDDDAVLVAGHCGIRPHGVCGYDSSTLTRLWIHNTVTRVGAACMLGTHALVTLAYSHPLLLDQKTGAHIVSLSKTDGDIFGLGVIEGLLFISP